MLAESSLLHSMSCSAHKHRPTRNEACSFWASVRSSPHRTKTRRFFYDGTLPVLAGHLADQYSANAFSTSLRLQVEAESDKLSTSSLPCRLRTRRPSQHRGSSVQLIFHTRPCRRDISLTLYVRPFSLGQGLNIPHIVLGSTCRPGIIEKTPAPLLRGSSAESLALYMFGSQPVSLLPC